MAASAASLAYVQKMFLAYFGRPVAPTGQDYYAGLIDAGNVAALQNDFWNSTESQSKFGSLTTEGKVTAIFQQLFGRDPAMSGLTYWTTQLSSGAVSLPTAALTILNSAAGDDLTVFNAKLSVADAFTAQLDTAAEVTGLQNNTAAAAAVLAGIKTTAAATAAIADIVNIVKGVVEGNGGATPGQTFTLTAGADLVAGTAADETIKALVVTNAQGNLTDSAQSVDVVDGGAGNDTLTIQTQSAAKLGMKVSNVETINYTTFGGQEFDMANTTGATKLLNTGSIANLTLSNVGNILDLGVSSVSGNKTSVTYAAAAVAGSTDTQKLTFSGATNNHTVGLNDAGIETYEITSSGSANKVVLDDIGTQVKTIKVAGDQALTLAFLDTTGSVDAITSVDGSAATGKLTLDLATNVDASDMTVKGGSADDKVTIGNFTKDDNVDLGAGIDTVVINAADATTVASVKLANNEILQFAVNTNSNDAAEAYTYNLAGATALTTVKVGNSTAGTAGTVQTLTLSALAASAAALELNGNGAAADESLNTVIWNLANSTGTADALAISVTNKDANGNLVNGTKGIQLTSAVTANGIETVSITTDQLHADTNATTQDGGLLLTLTADAVQTLNLTSATLLDINGSALGATVKKVDASAANGGVIVDMSLAEDSTTVGNGGTGTVNVTTGSGNDTVEKVLGKVVTTVSTGAGNDTVSLSAADIVKKVTINTGAGIDSIDLSGDTSAIEKNVTLGDGVDTVKIAADNTNAASQSNVIITDFVAGAGGDKIDIKSVANLVVTGNAPTKYVEIDFAAVADQKGTIGGMTVHTGTLADLSVATFVTAFGTTAHTAGDVYFVAASNGVDTAIYLVADNVQMDGAAGSKASDTSIAAGEVLKIVTLMGVADASSLSVDNFTDFLA